jgi:hypothetical protein
MHVSIFSTTFVRDSFHFKNKWERNYQKCILFFNESTRYSCQIWMNIELSPNRLLKHSQISNFMKICTVGAELFHADRQTDRYKGANIRFSQNCDKRLKTR